MQLEEDARRFIQYKRIEAGNLKPADHSINALQAISDHVKDFLAGRKPLSAHFLQRTAAAGLA